MKLQRAIRAFIVLGSLIAFWQGRDIFPFSDYPMYSDRFVPGVPITFRRFQGILEDGSKKTFHFQTDFPPFWSASFEEALLYKSDPSRIEKKLEATRRWYNARHPDEPIVKLRTLLYSPTWEEFIEKRKETSPIQERFQSNESLEYEVPR